jgi:hypothetical protein
MNSNPFLASFTRLSGLGMSPPAARKCCACSTYEKLQNLVRAGQVKKTGKKYRGVTKALLTLTESLKEFRKNGASFSPGPSLTHQ